MYNVGLIGLGMSGIRFIRALNYLHKRDYSFSLVGVYDRNQDNYDLLKDDVKTYNSLSEFMEKDNYDMVIVSANEEAHYEILMNLKKNLKHCKKYIVEKPLVSNSTELTEISSIFENSEIIVNYVERNSQIIEMVKNYIQSNNLDIIRMHFLWGKCRLYDSRPTIGASSEIVHPLDLCFYLLNTYNNDEINIVQGNYIKSDYSVSGSDILDTIDIAMLVKNEIIISGSSSFLWSNRKREISFYLQPNDKSIDVKYIIHMYFDSPRWDIDGYIICKIKSNGEREEVLSYTTSNSDDNETVCINKIIKFLRNVEKELEQNIIIDELHHLEQSYCIQKIMDDINNSSTYLSNHIFQCNNENNRYNNIREYIKSVKDENYNSILDTGY
ncbi:MAG: Gfo/Idh/MocA family oxidoreductase [Oscillospiraceae bacterium]|nr:Gfo/Idh/MocA family oxidoreductase [Oscillospiraceae bacterium]